MKKLFALTAILPVALFAVSVSAQSHAYKTATLNQTINLTAQIDQSATLSCPGSVFFDVKDATVTTNGDQNVVCTSKVSLHRGGSAIYSATASQLTGTESGGIIPSDSIWAKTNLSQGFESITANGFFAPLSYGGGQGTPGNPFAAAVLNKDMGLTFSFQLQPVPTMVPDIYTGTVTITLQVV